MTAGRRDAGAILLAAALATGNAARAAQPRFWEVARLGAEALACANGTPAEQVALLACRTACDPIPWQLDERDAHGDLVLDRGPQPGQDDPPMVVDANDELLWMVEDSGRRANAGDLSDDARCVVEIRLQDPTAAGADRWVYVVVLPRPAPRAARSYVRYDPERDVIQGARVVLGFGGATPQHLSVGGAGPNLLDRLKVRVRARFLGLIPVRRDEGDLTTEFVAWKAGPIRVIRRQRQWARIGWGIRSPTFGSDTYFYRDVAELPVRLRLNFPPTYFFRAIEIHAVLDFRDLTGWRLRAAGAATAVTVGATTAPERAHLNALPADWFALGNGEVALVQFLGVSASLATLTRRLSYEETAEPRPPEAVAGEQPGIGYRLSAWERVGSGVHWFASTSYALPAAYDLDAFRRERQAPLAIAARALTVPSTPDRASR
jgi:hypothetical protein